MSAATPVLDWGWHGLIPTNLSIESISMKSTRFVKRVDHISGREVSLQLPSFGVVTGLCPYVSSDFPRWREVVVFANLKTSLSLVESFVKRVVIPHDAAMIGDCSRPGIWLVQHVSNTPLVLIKILEKLLVIFECG